MKIWVVEVGPRWRPTVGVALSKDEAILELKKWKSMNPDDNFRIAKYKRKEQR